MNFGVVDRKVAERLAQAQVPPRARDVFALGDMIAHIKKTVPRRKIPGTVAGNVLRRHTYRTLMQQQWDKLELSCAPFQFGLGTRAGTKALALFLRFATDLNAQRVILATDCRGAFDGMRRATTHEKLLTKQPEILPYARQFYGRTSVCIWID